MFGYIMAGVLNSFPWWFWMGVMLAVILVIWIGFGGGEHQPLPLESFLADKVEEGGLGMGTPSYDSGSHRLSGEETCRKFLETHFGKKFGTVRPDWLKNFATGRNLELDCYNEELKLAVEYNGIQHYIFPNRFHATESEFVDQVTRDDLKRSLCDQRGVYLIVVPYSVKVSQIPSYIRERLP